MASGAHRAWRPAMFGWLVLGLTPATARAAPPPSEQSEARADLASEGASEQPRASVAPVIVVGSVGLASLTTAIVFTARSAGAARSLAADLDARVQYDQDDRRLHVGRRDALVAATMYGATAVVGALLLVCVLRPPIRAKPRRHGLAASVGPDGGALVLTVGF